MYHLPFIILVSYVAEGHLGTLKQQVSGTSAPPIATPWVLYKSVIRGFLGFKAFYTLGLFGNLKFEQN